MHSTIFGVKIPFRLKTASSFNYFFRVFAGVFCSLFFFHHRLVYLAASTAIWMPVR